MHIGLLGSVYCMSTFQCVLFMATIAKTKQNKNAKKMTKICRIFTRLLASLLALFYSVVCYLHGRVDRVDKTSMFVCERK